MAPASRYKSSPTDISKLASPLTFPFSNRDAPNRFLKAAMTEQLSSWDPQDIQARGIPSAQLINVYRRFGEGGFGVILTGNVMIDPAHLEAAGNAVIPRTASFQGERFEAFMNVATAAKAHGSLAVAQVSHPGRQVTDRLQKDPVSASDVQIESKPFGMSFAKPHAASAQEITDIIEGFAHAAEYLEKAGFDGIELHGAHGYLLAQFLAQTTNKRTDKYGGSLENRARIILEIGDEIRKRTQPGFVLGIKMNSVEFQEGGFQPEEAKKLASMLEEHKFEFVELSGGTYENLKFGHERESTKRREAFFLEWAEMITPALKSTKVYVTGGFRSAWAMVDALKGIDGVGLARPVCQEPYLPKLILEGKVSAAANLLLDENDFAVTNFAAGTQIRQIGNDQDPIDLTMKENVDAFLKDYQTWKEKISEDKDFKVYGYMDVASLPPVPYGTALSLVS